MMSFLFGFACGHVGKSYKAYTGKKPGITVVTAMQPSMALTISDAIFTDAALPNDICVLDEGSCTIPAMAKVALAENDNRRDIIPARDHLTFNAEDDIGIYEPINSS